MPEAAREYCEYHTGIADTSFIVFMRQSVVSSQKSSVVTSLWPRWRSLSAALALSFVVLPFAVAPHFSAAQTLPALGDTEREGLSPLMERKLGEQIMRDIRCDPDYLDDGPLLEYLNDFGAALVSVYPDVRGEGGYDFFFFAVRDPVLNAFALPGGFIAVHSGLLLAAQSESELASVLAHEIGHVAQRHIARMIGQQKQNSMIQLAAVVLGALAGVSKAGSDVAMATLLGGTGMAEQRQLNFSRDAEREADRIGLQILRDGGFDTSGMVAFFGRLQSASRNFSDVLPPYLQTHPLTTERMADIQARIRDQRYQQHAENPDFQLIRARVRLLQDNSAQGLRDAQVYFESQLRQNSNMQTMASKYGLAYAAYLQRSYDKAENLLQEARSAALQSMAPSILLDNLDIDIKMAKRHNEQALKAADTLRKQFPISRVAARQYAEALIASRHYDQAVAYLRDQAQLYRQEVAVQDLLARAYSGQGRQALQHMALAESYVLSGSLPAALDQLGIARKAPDAGFYEQAIIDARERELKELWQNGSMQHGFGK
jgi:predicted Zn-dependent protease